MKKLFALLFSFQLIISPVVLANSNIPGTEEDAYTTTGTGSKGGYDFYVNQVMTIATSAVGASILSQCLEGFKIPSISTFMGGSLVHILSEILAGKEKNEKRQQKLKELEILAENLATKGDSFQKDALHAQLKEEQEVKDFLEKRIIWMSAINVIYLTAMGLAIAEETIGQTAGNSLATAACGTYAGACTVAAAECLPHCLGGIAAAVVELKAISAMPDPAARTAINTLCLTFSPALVGCESLAQQYLLWTYGACQMQPVDGGASMVSWSSLLTLGYGLAASQAGSKQGQVSQYGTMLVGLANMFVPSLSKLVVQMYQFPVPRAITFGAAAVFSKTVLSGLIVRSNKAKKNVETLETSYNKFVVETAGTNQGTETLELADPSQTGQNINSGPKKRNKKDLAQGLNPKKCLSKGASGFDISEKGCANPFKIPKSDFSKFNLPTLSKVGNLTTDMVNALAAGDEAGAANISTEIGSYAAKVIKEVEALKVQHNELLKKKKQKPVDFDKSIKEQVASMQAALNSTAKQNNVNIAALGKGDSVLAEPAKAPDAINVTSAPVPAAEELAVPALSLGGDETVTEETAALRPEASPDNLDNYESTAEDINKAPEVSIFKQLSNRYILNYTKIFERKKAPEPVPEDPKN
jgi:hypothetical protein